MYGLDNYYENNDESEKLASQSFNPYVDQASLDNIRGYFHSTKKQHDDIKSLMLRKKEQELINDIKKHKEYRAKQSELRSMNDRIMGDLSLEYSDYRRKPVTKDLQVSISAPQLLMLLYFLENRRRHSPIQLQRSTTRNGKVLR